MEKTVPSNLHSDELASVSPHQRYLNPEPSDEPIFKSPKTLLPEKSTAYVSEARLSTELNSSSLQISTQQSINFKKSFALTSPKRSIPSTPLLLANKLKEIQGQSPTLKLAEKLKDLEQEANCDKTAELEEKTVNQKILDFDIGEVEAALELEGDVRFEIPQLRWCAFCKAEVLTEAEYVNTEKTFWSSVGIFMAGGVFGCFLLPYMTNCFKGVKVVCHVCKRPLSF